MGSTKRASAGLVILLSTVWFGQLSAETRSIDTTGSKLIIHVSKTWLPWSSRTNAPMPAA